jgi:hypothetical protein
MKTKNIFLTVAILLASLALNAQTGTIPMGNVDVEKIKNEDFTIIAKTANGITRIPSLYIRIHHFMLDGKHYITVVIPEVNGVYDYVQDDWMLKDLKWEAAIITDLSDMKNNRPCFTLRYTICAVEDDMEITGFTLFTFKNNLNSVTCKLYGSKFEFTDLELVQ